VDSELAQSSSCATACTWSRSGSLGRLGLGNRLSRYLQYLKWILGNSSERGCLLWEPLEFSISI
jgi:hypothetical protein